MHAELNLLPTVIVNPSSIVIYDQVLWDPCRPSRKNYEGSTEDLKRIKESFLHSDRKAHGNVSIQAVRKMSKAIDYLVTTSTEKKVLERLTQKTVRFKIAFITLTLPSKQIHPDTEIINTCLNSLLLELKKYYHLKNYVWRAEKQKNGNIHFHIILDKFVPWSELRDRWNRIVNKLGYVDRYREYLREWHKSGFKVRQELVQNWSIQNQQIAYQRGKQNDWANPNSTDIHSTKKIRNIKDYLTKYITKNESKPQDTQTGDNASKVQTGRVWGCNHELSNISGYRAEIDSETANELSQIITSGKCKVFNSQYFNVIYVNYKLLRKLGAPQLFKYFCNYLFEDFGYNVQLSLSQ